MFILKALSAAFVYITAVTAAPSVRNTIDLAARSQLTLPSGRTATSIVVEGDSDCADGFPSMLVSSHGEMFQVSVASSDRLLCTGKLMSYINETETYTESLRLAKRSAIAEYGEDHVEKRWGPQPWTIGVTLTGGSSISATLTLATVFYGISLLGIAAGVWWGFRYLTSSSQTNGVGKRSIDAPLFSNTTQLKVVGGQCTTSTCNGKEPATYNFYSVRAFLSFVLTSSSYLLDSCERSTDCDYPNRRQGFYDYDSVGVTAQSFSYNDDYDLTAQCLNQAHNAGYSNAMCRAWFEDATGSCKSRAPTSTLFAVCCKGARSAGRNALTQLRCGYRRVDQAPLLPHQELSLVK